MKTEVYKREGGKNSKADLPEGIFGVDWDPNLVHFVLRIHLNNNRQRTVKVKGRGEVKGGGRKPWRQKGTGRARHGSIRSPLWKGGGVTFGPGKKSYSKKANKKERRKALFSLLSKKLTEGEVKIVNDFNFSDYKTKNIAGLLNKIFKEEKGSVLFVASSDNKKINSAIRNIDKAEAISPFSLNIYDCLNYKYILIEQRAVEELVGHFGGKNKENTSGQISENSNLSTQKK